MTEFNLYLQVHLCSNYSTIRQQALYMTTITFLDRESFQQDIHVKKPRFEHEWINFDSTSAEQVLERCSNSEILVTNKVIIDRTTIESCPSIKHIAVTATGFNIVDLDACREHGISVSNIPSYATTTVPEHVLACAITLQRKLLRYRQQVLNGEWQTSSRFCLFDQPLHDLRGATFGVVGFGSLGQATAKLMHSVGMDIVYSSRSEKQCDFAQHVAFDDILSSADIISLHCPLTEETQDLINTNELEKMQDHAILINTARGGIVNERALADAIKAEQIAGAAFDVLCEEPPSDMSSPLFEVADLDNVILTPHIGWGSQEAMQALSDQVISNIEGFYEGKPINIVS